MDLRQAAAMVARQSFNTTETLLGRIDWVFYVTRFTNFGYLLEGNHCKYWSFEFCPESLDFLP
jgi:hypothetical protein